jgi:DNA processing protein
MARDCIQSGLSRAVIVVEAAERSGSVDTARRARKQGRLVLALPGSPGTAALLAAGAEPLDPSTAGLDALAARVRGLTAAPPEAQLGLWP